MPRDLFQELESRPSNAPRDLFEELGLAKPSSESVKPPSAIGPTLTAPGKTEIGDVTDTSVKPIPKPIGGKQDVGDTAGKTDLSAEPSRDLIAEMEDKSSAAGDWKKGMTDLKQAGAGSTLGMLEAIQPLLKYHPATWFSDQKEINNRIEGAKAAQIKRIGELQALPQEPVNPTYAKWEATKGTGFFDEAGIFKDAVMEDPIGFLRSFALRQAPNSIPSTVGGIAGMIGGPAGSAAGAGLGAFGTEFGSRVLDELRSRNVDLTDEKAIKAALATEGDAIFENATKDALIVSFIEGIGGGLSGRIATSGIKSKLAKEGLQIGTEAAAGAGGEAATQIRQTGGISDWKSIIAEAGGEAVAGGVMGAGQQGIHSLKAASAKYISRPSKVLTEDELKQLWEESNPETPISTYTEATNSGRTNYAYVEDTENGTPVEVGDYKSAEAKAGQGDYRRGRLIAVDDANTTTISKLGDTQALAEEAVNHDAIKGPGQVFRDVSKQFTDYDTASAFNRVYGAASRAAKSVIANGGDFASASAAAKQVFDTATEFNKKVFTGDAKSFQITPRTDNQLIYHKLYTADGYFSIASDIANLNVSPGSYKAIDLDKMKEVAEAEGWTIVPSVRPEFLKSHNMAQLADQTFSFNDATARSEFLVADRQQLKELFTSKRITWKGRLDPRFMGRGLSDGFALMDSTGTRVTGKDFEAKVPSQKTDFQQPPLPGHYWSGGSESSLPISKEIQTVWDTLAKGDEQIIGLGPSSSAKFRQQKALLEKWYKKFGGKNKVLFIYQRELDTIPVELQTMNLPHLKGPQFLGSAGYHGWYYGINPNIHVVVIKDTDSIYGGNPTQSILTLAHEFGHLMSAERLMNLPLDVLLGLHAAYRRQVEAVRANPDSVEAGKIYNPRAASNRGEKYQPSLWPDVNYQMKFEEWIAEQMTKYMTSRADTLGMIAKHLRSIAKEIVRFLRSSEAKDFFGKTSLKAEPEFEAFVQSMKDIQVVYEPGYIASMAQQASSINKSIGDEYPQSELSGPTRQVIAKHLGPLSPNKKNAKIIASEIDKYNWFYKWAANLRQLAEANPHITQLQLIREFLAFAKNDTSRILVGAEETLVKWRQLGLERGNNLTKFLFAMDAMEYLSPAEQAKNVRRWPTQQEFIALAQKYKLDGEMQVVYREVRDFFLNSVRRQEELQLRDAEFITDPVAKAAAIKAAKALSIELIKKPYFPQTRFGKWALTVRDANGKIEHFELFETKGELRQAGQWASNNFPSSSINLSTVPEEAMPFVGVPTWMLDQIRNMPGLTPDQTEWIEQFRYMIAPSQSFRKHLMKRKNYSGYSQDGQRVFASYAFHHARFYSRIKYDGGIRTAIESLRKSAGAVDSAEYITPRVQMADFLERVYREWRNPSRDWAKLRQLTAIWHLGFVPKSAIINMTQVPLATVPFLSSKFGGVKGESAILNAARKLSTYYKKGTIQSIGTDETNAIMQAVQDGYIDESMAAELAALAMGGGMGNQVGRAMAGDKFQRGYVAFTEKAMWMFRMAEQWNRRVTFRAAYQLAMDNPSAQYVRELRNKYVLKFAELHKQGWTEKQILAYLAGIDTIESTQYTYDREARPRYMQGRKSAFFAFQLFTQQTLWMLWNNKDMFARYILYSMLIGGAMGVVPDDAEELTKGIAYWLFGKDFDLEREVRKYVNDIVGGENADLLLHGTARYGFGIPKVAQMLGADFVPDVDLSGSATLNQILPISLRGLTTPGASWQDFVSQQAQNVAGATFGIPLGLMRAISATDLEISDFKRWEGAMPAAFRNVTTAMRRAYEGGERTRNYEQTLAYDGEDPEQAGELIAKAMGFRPLREAKQSEMNRAERELQAFWQTRKELLLRAAYRARFVHQDKEEYKEIMEQVRSFNKEAPDGKLKITPDGMKESFRRRLKAKQQVESGMGKAPPGIRKEVDQLYPGVREISRTPVK